MISGLMVISTIHESIRDATVCTGDSHPGLSRVMYAGSLPDDAFSEKFDSAALLTKFPIHLTTLEEFVRERVAVAKKAAFSTSMGCSQNK